MRKILYSSSLLYVICFLLCPTAVVAKESKRGYCSSKVGNYKGYKLEWAEEFETDGLPNPEFWDYEVGYERNSELQDYRKADLEYSYVEDGKLILKAAEDAHKGINKWTKAPYQFQYSSSSVTTKKKVSFEQGRLDIAAKIPTGRGVWPALWLMPQTAKYPGIYAECDIMEYVWGDDDKHETIYATIHTQDTRDGATRASGYGHSSTLESAFHLYSIAWTKSKVEILFDNEVIFTYDKPSDNIKQWPFDQPFYLIMNIAVGGSWAGMWGIDKEIFPKQMQIDYVRYYTKKR